MSDVFAIASSALRAAQAQMKTVSHNTANVQTPGYSRRTTQLTTQPGVLQGGQYMGNGVAIGATTRAVDEATQAIFRSNLSFESQCETRSNISGQVDVLLKEVAETNVSDAIDNFFSAVQQVSGNAAVPSNRQALLAAGKNLTNKVTRLNTNIQTLTNNTNQQIVVTVSQINDLATNMASLNTQIISCATTGTEPSDLLDQRDQLLVQLSKLVTVHPLAQANGAVDVYIGNSQPLVYGGTRTKLAAVVSAEDPSRYDIQADSSGSSQIITDKITGGLIAGLYGVRKDVIDPVAATLNRIVVTMAMTVNAQHSLGIDLNGNLGQNLFTDYNSNDLQLQRSVQNSQNSGTAQMAVSINPIMAKPATLAATYGAPTVLATGTLPAINAGDLTINGCSVGVPGADPFGFNTSAIAIANAINATPGINGTGITAKVAQNVINLGTFTPGAFTGNQLCINNQPIVSAGTDAARLTLDINNASDATGVTATVNNNNIILTAKDGRNINLTTTGGATASFANFVTTGGALAQTQRAAVTLNHPTTAITIAGTNPTNAGFTAGVDPVATTSLTDSQYALSCDGTNYTLTRQSDSTVVKTISVTDFNNNNGLTVDGMTIKLASGRAAAGDVFMITPTINAASAFAVQITDASKLAMASPIKVDKEANNIGNASISRGPILNATGLPLATAGKLGNAFANVKSLTPPIKIQIYGDATDKPTVYRVFDMSNGGNGVQIGPDQPYDPNSSTPIQIFPINAVVNSAAGLQETYCYDPGYRVAITGGAKVNDVFNISYNGDGGANGGNAIALGSLQTAMLLSGQTATYQGAYSTLTANIGAIAQTDETNAEAAESARIITEEDLQAKVGVNLDEEAEMMIKMQQLYQAASQIIATAKAMFAALLDAVRG